MTREERLTLLYKVAQLHYEEGKKKCEIANLVQQSSTQVANLLKEAKVEGIVSIQVTLPRLRRLQREIKNKFSLKDVVIVPYDADCSALLKRLGQASADYFEANVEDGSKIALGGGYLMYEMISMLPERQRDIGIFPAAIIARGSHIAHIDPLILVTLLWAKSGHLQERAHYVTVTPLRKSANSSQVRKHYLQLLRNEMVGELFESMKAVDWVFASIGGLDAEQSYIAATNYSTRNLLDEIKLEDDKLRKEGVIGDIIYSFFDENGETKPQWNIVATLGVNQLKKMAADPNKHVVVTVGAYKMRALKAVLRGKLCNTLITDARAAELLLKP